MFRLFLCLFICHLIMFCRNEDIFFVSQLWDKCPILVRQLSHRCETLVSYLWDDNNNKSFDYFSLANCSTSNTNACNGNERSAASLY